MNHVLRVTAFLLSAGFAVTVVGGPAAAQPTDPANLPQPTSRQLERAIRVWDPSGFVRMWDPAGTVTPLQQEATDGGETVLRLDSDILFAFDSAEPPATAGPAIAALLQGIPPNAPVTILGHTDSRGDDAYNLDLSQRRAEAVGQLVGQARPDLVLTVQGRGETEPVGPNDNGGEDNPSGRAANRRVDIRYVP